MNNLNCLAPHHFRQVVFVNLYMIVNCNIYNIFIYRIYCQPGCKKPHVTRT